MFELIARLKQRPVAARRRVAFITALTVTALIALMWVIWLSMGGMAARTGKDEPTAGTPAESLWLPLKRAVTDFTSSVFN